MRIKRLAMITLLGMLLVGCGSAEKVTALYFTEQELGGEPFSTRIIVHADWVRFDEGEGARDYVLYDRRGKVIYSVNPLDARVLVMPPRAVDAKPPMVLSDNVTRRSETMPPVGGRPVEHYQLSTNGALCYDLYAAKGLLPEAVQALREYHSALAGHQAAVLPATPKELQTPCDLANNIFSPARHLAHGLPVRVTENGRRTIQLVDFTMNFQATDTLFTLPANYSRTDIGELRGR